MERQFYMSRVVASLDFCHHIATDVFKNGNVLLRKRNMKAQIKGLEKNHKKLRNAVNGEKSKE